MSETPLFVEVLLENSLARPLDYSVPPHLASRIQVGARVEVPLKTTLKQGTIAAIKKKSVYKQVRHIHRLIVPEGALSEPLWNLAQWMSRYYATPLQKVLKCFVPPHVRKEVKQKLTQTVSLLMTREEAFIQLGIKPSAMHAQLIEALSLAKGPVTVAELISQLKISRSPLETLAKKKILFLDSTPMADLTEEEFFPTYPKQLNAEQSTCLDAIKRSLNEKKFASHLIYGITGSGKTEVYMQAIQYALEQKQSAILLVPEIALTSQTIERLRARFQQKIAVLHHQKSLGERSAAWDNLLKNQTQIVVGARSAIFAPAQNLGLIIVDEEHDSSYKQSDEPPCYHGRDVAVMRAQLEGATVILGSATPSLESYTNAQKGKYHLSILSSRAACALLPRVQIIDMKNTYEKMGGFTHFSEELIDALKERLEKGEQALFFLNKRGYRRQQICATCREAIKCPHCDLALTFHLSSNHLACHMCNFQREQPRVCPSCKSTEALEFKGFGTEHVERSLHALFPSIRTLRMDKDTTQRKNSHEELFMQFRAHKADVLIGTQMIAKGFHFPLATLVGVLHADGALHIPDFRSGEQVFQLITQVAGRAGRAELPGEVIIQTFLPNHPIISHAAAQDYPSFYAAEIEERKMFGYPPFCRLIKILFTGPDAAGVQQAAGHIWHQIKERNIPQAEILPILPAGHPKIKDLYRFQCIIKTTSSVVIDQILPLLPPSTSDLTIKVDVDPISTFF